MSYATLAAQPGKVAVQIVELHLEACVRTYGVAPCTAAIGTTGTQKCFNTTGTCQDRTNLSLAAKVYRFSSTRVDGLQQVGDPPTFPTLMAVKSAPTVLQPGKGLGVRSSVSIKIADHPWTDSGIDKYLSTRGYDPDERGSFWGRFLARNKHYENRRLDVLTGFLNDDGSYDAANFKRRTYIITKISGPGTGGAVSIEGKDPLRLADGEKAKWPQASRATLSADINNGVTSIPISDPELSITAWWALGQRYIRCEDEIMKATAIAGSGTTSPTLTVLRGTMPTWYDASANVAVEHDTGASFQPCHEFSAAPVYDIVYFLLNTVAGINSSYLPLSTWTANINDRGFSYLTFSTLLTEPMDAKKLLEELSQHTVLIWWDERASVVQLTGLRFQQLIGAQFNDDTAIVADSVSVTDDTASLLTQHWLYFDTVWPLADMTLLRSFRVVDLRANLSRESAEEYGKPAIRQMRSRWLPRASAGVATSIGSTMLKQYQDVRKVIAWTMDPKDDTAWVGDTVGVSTRYVQDTNGDPAVKNVLITQVTEEFSAGGMHLQYVGVELFAYDRVANISHPSGVAVDPTPAPPDYPSASAADRAAYAFIAYDDRGDGQPGFLDGSIPYQIT